MTSEHRAEVHSIMERTGFTSRWVAAVALRHGVVRDRNVLLRWLAGGDTMPPSATSRLLSLAIMEARAGARPGP